MSFEITKKNSHTKLALQLGAIVLAATLSSNAAANHIDFIQDDSNSGNGVTNAIFSLSAGTGDGVLTDTQMGESADILGGSRTVSISNTGFGQTSTVEKALGTDFISVTNGFVAAGDVVLSYLEIGSSDFSTIWDSIGVDIPVLDNNVGDGEINLSVTVTDGFGGMDTVFAESDSAVLGRIEDPGFFYFDFADYMGVDFSNVAAVSVRFETAIIGSDFLIGGITREVRNPVPPVSSVSTSGTLGMFSLGLLSLMYTKRKLVTKNS